MVERIETQSAPAAIGPYSQAIAAGSFLFVSGQIPLDSTTGMVVSGGIREQTKQVLANMEAILLAAGCSFDAVVKVDIFIRDMNDFAAINELYAAAFTGAIKPARQVVEVSNLPRDVQIEISCIAVRVPSA